MEMGNFSKNVRLFGEVPEETAGTCPGKTEARFF